MAIEIRVIDGWRNRAIVMRAARLTPDVSARVVAGSTVIAVCV